MASHLGSVRDKIYAVQRNLGIVLYVDARKSLI